MLWLLMLLALPLPLLIPGGGLIPAARMLLLGGLCVDVNQSRLCGRRLQHRERNYWKLQWKYYV